MLNRTSTESEPSRFTRYNYTSNPPPSYIKILKRMLKYGNETPFCDRNAFKGFLAKQDKDYRENAIADEARRFFLNEEIVSEENGKVLINLNRVMEILRDKGVTVKSSDYTVKPFEALKPLGPLVDPVPVPTTFKPTKEAFVPTFHSGFINPKLTLFLLPGEKDALELIRCCQEGDIIELTSGIKDDATVLSVCNRLVQAKVFQHIGENKYQPRVAMKDWNLQEADVSRGERRKVGVSPADYKLIKAAQQYVLLNPLEAPSQVDGVKILTEAVGASVKHRTAMSKLCYSTITPKVREQRKNWSSIGHFGVLSWESGVFSVTVPGFEVRDFHESKKRRYIPRNRQAAHSLHGIELPSEDAVAEWLETASTEDVQNFLTQISKLQSSVEDMHHKQRREQLKRELEQEEARAAAAAAEQRAAEERAKALAAELAELE